MRVDEINIPEPCHEDWDAMDARERGRFCKSCKKKVHNLSEMTQADARRLLAADQDLCVAYFEADGQVAFRPDPVIPISRLRPRTRVAAPAAAAGLALALVACAPHGEPPETRTQDAAPLVIPLGPVIPEAQPASDPAPPPPTVDESGADIEPEVEEVEPCEPTPPRDLQPVKGRKIRMGKPARQPQPILGQWG